MGILDKLLTRNILYYPGCMTKFVLKDLEKNYEEILRKCGIDFIKLKDLEVCCGSPVRNAGYANDFATLARKNFEIFKQHGIKKIISNCPACFKTFNQDYPEVLQDWNIEVEHATQTIWQAIKKGKLKIKKLVNAKITYHDPCHLGRYVGVYDEPREILKFLGYDLVEMEFNKADAFCCGGGGGVKVNYPKLAEKIAKDRITQALKTNAKLLVTTCPLCYACLREASKNKIKVIEFSSLLIQQIKD
jgi:Fe-S oxidoreductase